MESGRQGFLASPRRGPGTRHCTEGRGLKGNILTHKGGRGSPLKGWEPGAVLVCLFLSPFTIDTGCLDSILGHPVVTNSLSYPNVVLSFPSTHVGSERPGHWWGLLWHIGGDPAMPLVPRCQRAHITWKLESSRRSTMPHKMPLLPSLLLMSPPHVVGGMLSVMVAETTAALLQPPCFPYAP